MFYYGINSFTYSYLYMYYIIECGAMVLQGHHRYGALHILGENSLNLSQFAGLFQMDTS